MELPLVRQLAEMGWQHLEPERSDRRPPPGGRASARSSCSTGCALRCAGSTATTAARSGWTRGGSARRSPSSPGRAPPDDIPRRSRGLLPGPTPSRSVRPRLATGRTRAPRPTRTAQNASRLPCLAGQPESARVLANRSRCRPRRSRCVGCGRFVSRLGTSPSLDACLGPGVRSTPSGAAMPGASHSP